MCSPSFYSCWVDHGNDLSPEEKMRKIPAKLVTICIGRSGNCGFFSFSFHQVVVLFRRALFSKNTPTHYQLPYLTRLTRLLTFLLIIRYLFIYAFCFLHASPLKTFLDPPIRLFVSCRGIFSHYYLLRYLYSYSYKLQNSTSLSLTLTLTLPHPPSTFSPFHNFILSHEAHHQERNITNHPTGD